MEKKNDNKSRQDKNLFQRGQVWYVRSQRKGRDIKVSLETTNKTIARQRKQQIIKEIAAGKFDEGPSHTFNELSDKFTTDYHPTLKINSAKRYGVSQCNLLDHYSGLKLSELTRARFREFETARRLEGVTNSTILRDLACLSSMLSFAEDELEWIENNLAKKYIRVRKKKGLQEAPPRTRYFTHAEEAALLDNASDVMQNIIIFAIETGLRREEIFSLKWSKISHNRNTINIDKSITKNKRPREIAITPRAKQVLDKLKIGIDNLDGYVFTSYQGNRYSKASGYVWEALQKAGRKGNVEDIQFHDLRRTCGCRLLQDRGWAMERVCNWLGHSSVNVTERIYAFLEVEHLARELEETEERVVNIDTFRKSEG